MNGMERNMDILKELQQLAPELREMPAAMPFSLPDNYFVLFPSRMLLKIYSKQNTLSVPEGYFENFSQTMLNKVKSNPVASELDEVAPFLNRMPKTMPYQIPAGYFEALEWKREQPTSISGGKVVSLFGPKLKQWAVAAAIATGVLWGGWWLSNRTADTTQYAAVPTATMEIEQLAGVEEGAIFDYLDVEDNDMLEFATMLFNEDETIENKLQTIHTNDLISYLNASPEMQPRS
jgi:hypothetical protein